MPGTQDRELLENRVLDLSGAGSSAVILTRIQDFVQEALTCGIETPCPIALNTGDVMLSKGALAKLRVLCAEAGLPIELIYSALPQTQQAALDEGFYVRDNMMARKSAPLRMPLLQEVDVKHATGNGHKKASLLDLALVKEMTGDAAPELSSDPVPVQKSDDPPAPVHDPVPAEVGVADSESFPQDIKPSPSPTAGPLGTGTAQFIKGTLRSGRVVRVEGDVVIIGDVHAGSEVVATGDVMIWGLLQGVAHAGAPGGGSTGNFAEIRALEIDAIQLRIGDFIARQPDRIYYHKDMPGHRSAALIPEMAKVSDGEIKVFKEVPAAHTKSG